MFVYDQKKVRTTVRLLIIHVVFLEDKLSLGLVIEICQEMSSVVKKGKFNLTVPLISL